MSFRTATELRVWSQSAPTRLWILKGNTWVERRRRGGGFFHLSDKSRQRREESLESQHNLRTRLVLPGCRLVRYFQLAVGVWNTLHSRCVGSYFNGFNWWWLMGSSRRWTYWENTHTNAHTRAHYSATLSGGRNDYVFFFVFFPLSETVRKSWVLSPKWLSIRQSQVSLHSQAFNC